MPDGASFLASWWISQAHAPYSGCAESRRAASATSREKTFTPIEKFAEKYKLTFPLASDEATQVCEAYGTWVEKSMYGKKYMGIERSTFLVDAKGKIAKAWRKVSVNGHAAEVMEAAKALG